MYGKRAFDSEYIQYVALYNQFLALLDTRVKSIIFTLVCKLNSQSITTFENIIGGESVNYRSTYGRYST
jgi:hypothetical protein